jgi:glycosyltransferase involved in cell wall biosynthesis
MTSAPPKVSVIVPAYNRAELIGATLGAIARQSVPVHEVIVCDDGSTDGTAERAEQAGGCRVLRGANVGAPGARHRGALAAGGDWLAFCDSDDLWREDHVAGLIETAALAPSAPLIFSNFVLVRDGHWEERDKFADAPADFWRGWTEAGDRALLHAAPVYPKLLSFQPIFASCFMIRAGFYREIGGYRAEFGRLGAEDFEFVLRCAARSGAAAVRHPSVGIRRHTGNFSADQLKVLAGEIAILRHSLERHGLDPAWRSGVLEQIEDRSGQAFDLAFSAADWPALAALRRDGPSKLAGRRRLKATIAALPGPLRTLAWRLTQS